MNSNKSSILFVAVVALFVGMSGGYVVGNWRATARNADGQAKIFGAGRELIDQPKDPGGAAFDLTSAFAVTNDFFHCVVETNDKAFTMQTYGMGTVEIPKNQFFMAVDSVSIESVQPASGGRAELKGTARSITRVGDKYEEAVVPFSAVAVDGGPGREKDSLVLTVFFDKNNSPMQFAIFGPEPRFGKSVDILSGDIAISGS
jgi:hypothetical protein